ncbi:lipase family protein [Primorskyibacter sp. S187A]|uniref:lipase family protein n=1 Tax=Primorskyibacter sp. S187A TaxID=3415130 RepID=UPI003C79F85C
MPVFDTQGLSTDQIEELARLSRAAYEENSPPSDWTAVTGTELDAGYSGITFTNGGAAARVFRKDGTLVVSFRGTDDPLSDGPDFLDIFPDTNAYIDNFNALLSAVAAYVQDESNGVTTLQVTGHSLGGAAANLLRNVASSRYDGVFDDADFVAFAAPTMSTNPSILNVGFMNDWVFKAFYANGGLTSTGPTDFFASATDRIVWYNDLLFLNNDLGLGIRQIPEFLVNASSSPHQISNYIDAVERISASEFYAETTRDTTILLAETDFTVRPLNPEAGDNTGPVLILGRSQADILEGGSNNDFLEGLGGNDLLIGLAGNDKLSGGFGRDEFIGGAGDDTINGGGGSQDIAYYTTETNLRVNLSLQSTNARTNEGNDQLQFVEHIVGTSTADQIDGNAQNNMIIGFGGRDFIDGGEGNDTLIASDGDRIAMVGGSGDDLLFFEDARDVGATGDEGNDTFVFNNVDGNVRITDFTVGEDVIVVNAFLALFFNDVDFDQAGTDTTFEVDGTTYILNDVDASLLGSEDVFLV